MPKMASPDDITESVIAVFQKGVVVVDRSLGSFAYARNPQDEVTVDWNAHDAEDD